MPLISVILPCYNVSAYIDRCLASLATQSIGFANLEIICVDDCSADDTFEHLSDWERKWPEQVLLVKMPENRGLSAARNAGLSYASAPYVVYIDSDDWLHPQYLEALYLVAEQEQVQMVSCGHVRDFGDGRIRDEILDCAELGYHRVDIDSDEKRSHKISLIGAEPMAWSKLLRKDFLLENGLTFPEGLTYEDNYWHALLSGTVESYCVLEAPLYHYFVNERSITLLVNQTYHVDYLTVQLLAYEEMKRRGWTERYRDAVEFHMLHSICFDFLKIICLRFDPPAYSLFRLLQSVLAELITIKPENNTYYETGFTEFQKMVLAVIGKEVTKSEFVELAELVKKRGL